MVWVYLPSGDVDFGNIAEVVIAGNKAQCLVGIVIKTFYAVVAVRCNEFINACACGLIIFFSSQEGIHRKTKHNITGSIFLFGYYPVFSTLTGHHATGNNFPCRIQLYFFSYQHIAGFAKGIVAGAFARPLKPNQFSLFSPARVRTCRVKKPIW